MSAVDRTSFIRCRWGSPVRGNREVEFSDITSLWLQTVHYSINQMQRNLEVLILYGYLITGTDTFESSLVQHFKLLYAFLATLRPFGGEFRREIALEPVKWSSAGRTVG